MVYTIKRLSSGLFTIVKDGKEYGRFAAPPNRETVIATLRRFKVV